MKHVDFFIIRWHSTAYANKRRGMRLIITENGRVSLEINLIVLFVRKIKLTEGREGRAAREKAGKGFLGKRLGKAF